MDKKTQSLEQIKKLVSKIKIEKRDTKAGIEQREKFKKRWGISPEEL